MPKMKIKVHEGKKDDINELNKEFTDLWYKFHGGAGMGEFTLADFGRMLEIRDDAKFAGSVGSTVYNKVKSFLGSLSTYDYEKLFGVKTWR